MLQQVKQQAFRPIPALTSNLNSPLNSPFPGVYSPLFFLIMAIGVFFAQAKLYAADSEMMSNWNISEEIKISPSENIRLHQRTKDIETQSDFQTILTSLALRHPFTQLRFESKDSVWLVRGIRGVPITKIDFELAPVVLLNSLRTTIAPYIGQVHSEALLARISLDVVSNLKRLGYSFAKVTSESKASGDGVEYTYRLDIGDPCIVKGFQWEQSPPIKIDQAMAPGDICTEEGASKAISETEIKARAAGYIDANLAFDKFQFVGRSNSAMILVKGDFGLKVVYEFVNQTTGTSLSSIFSNADMQAFDPAILSPDSVNFELTRQLKIRGYSSPQIFGTAVPHPEAGTMVHTFSVLLGENTTIGRLQVEGNVAFSTSEILTLLQIERPSQSEGQLSEVIFNPDAVSAGVERIRANYINHGFWDVKVVDRQVESQANGGQTSKVAVVITIEEGERRVFHSLKVVGNASIPVDDLSEFVKWDTGSPLDRSQIVDLQQKVRSYYALKGYFYTTAVGEVNLLNHVNGTVETMVVLRINEGPRVKFGDVFITGLVRTDPKVVLRELYFETGDWYDPELVSLSRLALLRIGAFATVAIAPLDPDISFKQSPVVDLLIQVTESPSRTVNFGPGWSSYYGFRYNLEGALTNIGGTGRQLFGRASFNEESHQKAIGSRTLLGRSISAGYLEPYMLDSSIDGTISVAQSARATEYAWSLTRSGEVELSQSLKAVIPGSKISLFYAKKLSAEEGRREDVDAFLADTFSVGRVGLRFLIDKKNDPVWTSSGYTIGSELSWARYNFGGDLRYFRWEFTNNHYFSAATDWVFAFGLNFASFEDVERRDQSKGDVLPASERLPAGGADSIRGFHERSLGPIVRRPSLNAAGVWDCGFSASPTGGSRRLILKAESRYRFTAEFAGTLFVDSGTSSFSQTEMQKFKAAFSSTPPIQNPGGCQGSPERSIEDNLGYEVSDVASNPKVIWNQNYSSVGTAVNFLTPIGAINLAYGIPWHEPKSERCVQDQNFCYPRSNQSLPLWQRGEFHFNVGSKF
jgi:outer membrane protein insertion porin family